LKPPVDDEDRHGTGQKDVDQSRPIGSPVSGIGRAKIPGDCKYSEIRRWPVEPANQATRT
jgi:hypothetical protein